MALSFDVIAAVVQGCLLNLTMQSMPMRLQGKITRWNDDQGFGFITPNGGGEAVFVHIKALAGRAARPEGGELVSYDLARDAQGRPRAEQVEYAGARTNPVRRRHRNPLPVLLALAFLGSLWGAVSLGSVPMELAGLYLLLSVLTYIAYALDKSAAQQGNWRTKESTLHLLALIGGWPGALLAQHRLRHKSSKQPFRAIFWMTVAANAVALGWLLSDAGTGVLAAVHAFIGEDWPRRLAAAAGFGTALIWK